MPNPTNRHQELKAQLERLKLTGMATHFSDLALRAAKEGLSHEDGSPSGRNFPERLGMETRFTGVHRHRS